MTDSSPLYNSRIIKTFQEHLRKSYPDLDIDSVLEYSEITKYEVEDPAHWFSQSQTDRFHEALDLLATCGYTHVSFFLDRQRSEIPIDVARDSLPQVSPAA